jgi:hypothetical protein
MDNIAMLFLCLALGMAGGGHSSFYEPWRV